MEEAISRASKSARLANTRAQVFITGRRTVPLSKALTSLQVFRSMEHQKGQRELCCMAFMPISHNKNFWTSE